MYSRYVPPPKAKVDSNFNGHQKHNPNETQLDSIQPQQPIQSDASATYARYIPPSKAITQSQQEHITEPTKILTSHPKRKSDELHDYLEPKAKKSKKVKEKKHESEDVSNNNGETAPIEAQDAEEVEAEELVAKSVKRRKIKERQDPDVEMEELTAVDDPRHAKLLAKREKSFKKAARTARKQALYDADGAVEGIEATIEEPPDLHDLEPLPQPEPVPAPVGGTFSALPPWLESPIRVTPDARASFTDLGLHKSTMDVLKSKGFEDAFAVQAAVLPLFLGPEKQLGDVLISAATGSGKTLAYVLPVIQDISNTTVPRLRGLIVMPTRELVSQAREVCEICANAFSSTSRRRINIGVAVGNQTLSAEQATLMAEELEYDPVEYQRREDAANARWETASQESDNSEEFILDQDESFAGLPNHISKPTLKVDILICTPGRLVEHLKSTPGFTLEHIKWLVVDEADKLLDQSFQQWLEIVMSQLPKKSDGDVRKIVLSATMTRDLGLLAGLKLYRPKLVVLESNNEVGGTEDQAERHGEALSLPETLVESAVKVENDGDKPLYLLHLLKHYLEAYGIGRVDALPESDISSSSDSDTSDEETESSSSESGMETSAKTNGSRTKPMKSSNAPKGILIFTKSNESALRLARLLALLEPSLATKISTLTSTIRASTRRKTLRSFHNGTTSILLASDLVSRGLDLPDLAHVVNYDLPTSLTSYIHRVGRTARAGRTGYAWTLFSKTEARWFWNEISRSERVIRPRGGKVARINIDDGVFGDELRKEYENALEALGKEASGA